MNSHVQQSVCGSQPSRKKGPGGACSLFLALYLVRLALSGRSWEGFRVGSKAPSIMRSRNRYFFVHMPFTHAIDRPAEASELVLSEYDLNTQLLPQFL